MFAPDSFLWALPVHIAKLPNLVWEPSVRVTPDVLGHYARVWDLLSY